MFGRVCLLCSLSRPVVSAHLSRTHQLRALYSSYESQYSLNKLYPGSDQDVTKPLDKPSKELFLRLQDDIEEVTSISFHLFWKIKMKLWKLGVKSGSWEKTKVRKKTDLKKTIYKLSISPFYCLVFRTTKTLRYAMKCLVSLESMVIRSSILLWFVKI